MSFTHSYYLAFFVAVFLLYWGIRNRKAQNVLLVAASFIFYAWVDRRLLLILALSVLVNFLASVRLEHSTAHKKAILWLGLGFNIGVLAFYKYFNFFIHSAAPVFDQIGLQVNPYSLEVILPVGLSFYSFQNISYLVDVYRGEIGACQNPVDFSLYVTFFPKLIAGPIERARALLPQIEGERKWSWARLQEAWPLLVMGYLNKVMIADNVSILANKVFMLDKPSLFMLLCATLAFTVQIYADFLGYTQMARGFAKLLGFELVRNFDSPYLAVSPGDFWNRWHISLSNWLRDYIFFPVRRALLKKHVSRFWSTALPPLVTMLVSGLWHGTGWNYFLWGAYYGVLLALYQLLGLEGKLRQANWWGKVFGWMVMFPLVVFGWLVFRAPNLRFLAPAFTNPVAGVSGDSLVIGFVVLCYVLFFSLPMLLKLAIDRLPPRWAALEPVYLAAALTAVILYSRFGAQSFIYFQF